MTMPIWWGHINKRLFNPRALKSGKWTVLRHVGRVSGRPYRTPIGTFRVADTFYLLIVYGPKTDWLRNVLNAGSAVLEVEGEEISVHRARLVSVDEAFRDAPPGTPRPPGIIRIDQCLALDVV
jgi:deazaflavin-dependent oxidoreductase (nitroreductase family)